MVRIGSDDGEEATSGLSTNGNAQSGWERTLQDVEAMATDRAESGFETVILTADSTTPKPPAAGDSDEWGLVYIVPSNQAEEYLELADRAQFDETIVYQASAGGRAFVVTECLDTDADLVLYVAGTYELQYASPLVETAIEREDMYTHLKKLDGTHLGTIEHDDAEQFFPDPEQIYAYDVNR